MHVQTSVVECAIIFRERSLTPVPATTGVGLLFLTELVGDARNNLKFSDIRQNY